MQYSPPLPVPATISQDIAYRLRRSPKALGLLVYLITHHRDSLRPGVVVEWNGRSLTRETGLHRATLLSARYTLLHLDVLAPVRDAVCNKTLALFMVLS